MRHRRVCANAIYMHSYIFYAAQARARVYIRYTYLYILRSTGAYARIYYIYTSIYAAVSTLLNREVWIAETGVITFYAAQARMRVYIIYEVLERSRSKSSPLEKPQSKLANPVELTV